MYVAVTVMIAMVLCAVAYEAYRGTKFCLMTYKDTGKFFDTREEWDELVRAGLCSAGTVFILWILFNRI